MKGCFLVLGLIFFLERNGIAQSAELSPVYDGREYIPISLKVEGSPYFNESVLFGVGDVHFDNVLYTSVPLLYDLVTDQLVIQRNHLFVSIIVVKNFVEGFSLGGSTFVHLKEEVDKPGYYEQIFKSDSYQAFIKHSKIILNHSSTTKVREYHTSKKFFYRVGENGPLLQYKRVKALFPDNKEQKKAIKGLLKQNDLEYVNNLREQTSVVFSYLSTVSK